MKYILISICSWCFLLFFAVSANAVWAHDPPCGEARGEVNARLDDLKKCLSGVGEKGADDKDLPLCEAQLKKTVEAEKIYNVCLIHNSSLVK